MLRKLMEAEEKAVEETPPPVEAPAEEAPTEETPAEAPEEAPETPAAEGEAAPAEEAPAEEAPAEETPEEAPETPAEETPTEATEETATEKPKDESEETAKKIEDLSKKQVVDDYDLTKQLKFYYEPILNADTLKEKTKAIKNYQEVIDKLAKKSKENYKVKDALEKIKEFIKPGDEELADYISKKLSKTK